jgi:hypothetical protein
MLHSQACGTAAFLGSKYERAMAETAGHPFFQKLLPGCNEPPQPPCCAFFGVSAQGKSDAAPYRATPPIAATFNVAVLDVKRGR